jgi:hypothetical protein
VSQLSLERIPLGRFLQMGFEDLCDLSEELANSRAKHQSPLHGVALGSLIRVMDRKGYETISQLGQDAATAWATHIGVG